MAFNYDIKIIMIGHRYYRRIATTLNYFRILLQSYRFKTSFLKKMADKTARCSPLGLLFSSVLLKCSDDSQENVSEEFEELTMPQLVQVLHSQSGKEFVVVIYDRFKKTEDSAKFAEELKAIVDECSKAKIHTIYTIQSKDAEYLREIVRRLRNQSTSSDDQTQALKQQNKKTFQCYYKSKCYSEAFELLNNRSYKIGDQIKQIRHLNIETNRADLAEHLNSHMATSYDFNKSIVVKQCPGEGECLDSFKRQVSKLIEDGMFNWKSSEFEFQLVVDHPTGILGKSSDYVKNMQNQTEKIMGKHHIKKQDVLLFRRDILGKKTDIWSHWLQREGLNFESGDRLMMFIRPRVNIISKYSTFTDVMWYLRTSRLNPQLALSLNNTDQWQRTNSPTSLQVLKLFHRHYPRLNYLIFNARSVGQIFHHMYSDHKYVFFEQSHQAVWNKVFLDLDRLQNISDDATRQRVFEAEFKPKIDQFIQNPTLRDQVVIEKEQEITFDRLKLIRDRQCLEKEPDKGEKYILRVCSNKCGRYLPEHTVGEIQKTMNQQLPVYWIDGSSQNVGVRVGDYLLAGGKLVSLDSLLNRPKTE